MSPKDLGQSHAWNFDQVFVSVGHEFPLGDWVAGIAAQWASPAGSAPRSPLGLLSPGGLNPLQSSLERINIILFVNISCIPVRSPDRCVTQDNLELRLLQLQICTVTASSCHSRGHTQGLVHARQHPSSRGALPTPALTFESLRRSGPWVFSRWDDRVDRPPS